MKSKLPKRQAWAESLGWRLEERRWFRVMSHWGRRRSHSLSGKFGSQEQRPAMKWFLKVWMARSAALRRWLWGGTRWKSILYFVKAALRSDEHSMSRICRSGAYPLDCSFSKVAVHAVVRVLLRRLGIAVDKIALEL